MDVSERIQVLKLAGLGRDAIAAILDAEPSGIADYSLSSVAPDVGESVRNFYVVLEDSRSTENGGTAVDENTVYLPLKVRNGFDGADLVETMPNGYLRLLRSGMMFVNASYGVDHTPPGVSSYSFSMKLGHDDEPGDATIDASLAATLLAQPAIGKDVGTTFMPVTAGSWVALRAIGFEASNEISATLFVGFIA